MNQDRLRKVAITLLYIERKKPDSIRKVLNKMDRKISKRLIEEMKSLKHVDAKHLEIALEELKDIFSVQEFSAGTHLIKKLSSSIQSTDTSAKVVDMDLFQVFNEVPLTTVKQLMKHDPPEVLLNCYRYLNANDLSVILKQLDVEEASQLTQSLSEEAQINNELIIEFDAYMTKRVNQLASSSNYQVGEQDASHNELLMKLSRGYENLDIEKQEQLLSSLDEELRSSIRKYIFRLDYFIYFENELKQLIFSNFNDLDLLAKAMSGYDVNLEKVFFNLLTPRQKQIYKENRALNQELDHDIRHRAEKELILFIKSEIKKRGYHLPDLISDCLKKEQTSQGV